MQDFKYLSITDTWTPNPKIRVNDVKQNYLITDLSVKDFNELCKKETVDLSKVKKLYFLPIVKYPRSQITANPNLKRSLKLGAADAIVIPDNIQYYPTEIHVIEAHGIKYGMIEYYYNLFKQEEYKHLFEEFLGEYTILDEIQYLYDSDNKLIDLLHLLTDPTANLVCVSQLNRFLANNFPDPEEEDLNSIEELLSSSDQTSVELGIKLLCSFNITKHLTRIALIIYNYGTSIYQNKGSNSIVFINLLSTLKFNKSDLIRYNGNKLNLLLEIFNIITDDEDNKKCKELILQESLIKIKSKINQTKYLLDKINYDVIIELRERNNTNT